ncbi:MAG: DnaD domain protein [Lachnospiraceae bacterium]|nr:DnaD domain protein [Lachnospiraceae bacterium]
MMGRVTINQNNGDNVTSISNIFIDEYMGDANDAQIKIYLYLLRMMAANLPTSVNDIADKFNHTEKDVLRSLKYWEKQGLITLYYGDNGELTSIHMEDIVPHKNQVKTHPDTFLISVPNKQIVEKRVKSSVPQKPVYSAADINAFSSDPKSSSLLFIAEQYFCKTLTPSDIRTIFYIHDELKFSDDLIDYLMQYCADNNKKDFRYMEKVAVNWSEQNITTVEQARSESFKYNDSINSVMKALGMENRPTEKEVSFISKWQEDYGFTMEIILEACGRTVLATQRNRLKYCDGILRKWFEHGVKMMDDIAKEDAAFTAGYAQNANKGKLSMSGSSNNRFNNFTQNDYDFDELEKQILDN